MMKRIRGAIVVVIVWGFATQIVAKEASSGSGSVLTLEDLLNAEVIQGASKYQQPVKEAPAATHIVTARDIRAHGWRYLKDLLNSVGGFYFTSDRFYSYVGVRGYAPLGDFNTNVLVTIDGHRLNENIFDSVGYGWDFPLDMEVIDHVEIIRGPGSSIYGNSAICAVINIYTKKVEGSLGIKTQAETMTRGSSRGLVAVKDGSGKVRWEASASAFYSGGYQSLYFPEFDSSETNHGVVQNGDGERQRRAFTTIQWGRWSLQGLYNHRWKDAGIGSFGTDFGDIGTNIVDRRGYLDLSYEGDPDAETYFSGRGYLDNYIYRGDYITSGVINRDYSEGDWFGGEAQVVTNRLPRQTLVAGVEGRKNIHQLQNNYDVDGPTYLSVDEHASQWAVFGQDEIHIAQNVHGYLGLRYDHPSYTTGTTMPRIALAYELNEKTTFKAMYGESYRTPTQFEMFYVDDITYRTPGILKPETIKTYEIVADRVLNRSFSVETSAFVYNVHDLLVFKTDSDVTETGRTVNLSEANAQGLEALVRYRSGIGLTAHASYDYQYTHSSLIDGEMVNAPRHLGKIGCEIPLLGEEWLGGVEWQLMSNRKTDDGSNVGGYGVVNLNVSGKDWPTRGVECSAGVFNVFNREYLDPVASAVQDTLMQDGRCLHFKVALEF